MTAAAGEAFEGLHVDEARNAVVAALRKEGLVSGTQPFVHEVPHSHRSGQRIEPLISLQWFCDMTKLAEPAIAAAKDGTLRFHPERPHRQVYLNWLENIRPWCISRQLWWGHQLPVWYRGDETYVGSEPPEGDGWERDPDVLDTWFSSALWPFATLGWPDETPELRAFYPTDVLVDRARHHLPLGRPDGDDGARVHRRAAVHRRRRSLDHPGPRRAPDVEVARHRDRSARHRRGRRAAAGVRAGGGVPGLRRRRPALRAARRCPRRRTCASTRSASSRAPISPTSCGTRRGSCCCASRTCGPSRATETVEDRWIVSRLERLTERVTELYEGFAMSHAALELYEGFWTDVCDWYLELVKPRLYGERGRRRRRSCGCSSGR